MRAAASIIIIVSLSIVQEKEKRGMRKAAIYEKENRPYKSDWELAMASQKGSKADTEELWDKYFCLRQKEKFSFLRWCKEHFKNVEDYEQYFEAWDSEAYEKFIMQMKGIRFNELKAKGYGPSKTDKRWGIAIRLQGYFESVNRQFTGALLRKANNEVHIKSVKNKSSSSENTLTNIDLECSRTYDTGDNLKALAKKVFNEAYSRMLSELSPDQKKLLNMKAENKRVGEICKTMGTSSSVVKQVVSYSKSRLSSLIKTTSRRMGSPMTYDDVVSYLAN